MNEIKSVVNGNYTEVGDITNLTTPITTSIVNAINSLLPVELYNNVSGTAGDVALSDSSANYTYIEIFFRSDFDNDYGSVKIYQPNGKTAGLFMMKATSNTTRVYMKNRTISISGTSITNVANSTTASTIINGANPTVASSSTSIYITRVIGFK